MQALNIGTTPLQVQLKELPSYVIAQWIGAAPESASGIASEASTQLLARAAEHVVLDLGRLSWASEPVVRTLALALGQALREGRSVCLVRCSADLYGRLRACGLSGSVAHAGSLSAATQGLAGEPANIVDLYVRSSPDLLHRLRNVVSAVAREARLSDDQEMQLKMAVTEAAANAILHGSPEGPRNHVRVSFHLDSSLLIVDVADQGRGFDPTNVPPPAPAELKEHGYGIHLIRQAVDRVEFFRDESGMLVRMTKRLGHGWGGWAETA